jgi:hypothetical protein
MKAVVGGLFDAARKHGARSIDEVRAEQNVTLF